MVTYYLIASGNIWNQLRLIHTWENKTHSHFTVLSTNEIVFFCKAFPPFYNRSRRWARGENLIVTRARFSVTKKIEELIL